MVVKGPIALAALLILVFFVITIIIVQKLARSTSQLAQSVSRYGFVAASLVSIVAIGAYVYVQFLAQDLRISGVVIDENGKPVDFADVSIDGGPTQPADDGKFAFLVERKWFPHGYTIRASDIGYEDGSTEVISNLEAPQKVVLRHLPISAQVETSDIRVSHLVGLPWISASFTINNNSDFIVHIDPKLIIGHVSTSIGGKYFFLGAFHIVGTNPVQTKYYIDSNSTLQVTGFFFRPNPGFDGLAYRVDKEIATHPWNNDLSVKTDRISTELATELRQYAEGEFFWASGNWKLSVCISIERRNICNATLFSLTDLNIIHMLDILSDYQTGVGLIPGIQFGPLGNPIDLIAIDAQ